MKLFQYYNEENEVCTGAVINGRHVALCEGTELVDLLNCSVGDLEKLATDIVMPVEEIRFAPVVSAPEKILCIGLNYDAHIKESGLENNNTRPGFPPVFAKFANSLLPHKGELHLPKKAYKFDYEAELVIVIGKDCKEAEVAEAPNYIAGYAVGNDFSARDMQFVSSQWTLGKAADEFAPVGPYFVSADEVDVNNLSITCKVNGEYVQQGNTNQMIYNCSEIVSYLSDYITLKKGDLIYTGTPAGVVLGKKENPVWLKAGDVVTVEIEGLGILENKLV